MARPNHLSGFQIEIYIIENWAGVKLNFLFGFRQVINPRRGVGFFLKKVLNLNILCRTIALAQRWKLSPHQ
jgi:hypothetical protein